MKLKIVCRQTKQIAESTFIKVCALEDEHGDPVAYEVPIDAAREIVRAVNSYSRKPKP